MTFAIFFILILGVLLAFLNIIPTADSLGFSFQPAVETIVGYMKAWDWIFPIHELFVFLTIYVGLEITLWTLRTLRDIIKFLRGHSDGA